MSSLVERLRLAAAKDAALMDRLSETFARQLAAAIVRIDAEILDLARTLLTVDETGRLVSDQAAIGRAVALRTDLVRAMRRAGYGDLIDTATGEPFLTLADEVVQSSAIAARAEALTATDLRALSLIQDERATELLAIANDAAQILSNTILNGVVGAAPKDLLIADLSIAIDASFAQAHTIYDTALSIFARQVDQLKATGAADELFLYVGPVDQKVRPFCRRYVGRVLERQAIERLDNGQLPNVLLTGGGYNCRHQWKRVTRFDQELKDLAASGNRAPEVQADLARVAAQEAAIAEARARERERARLRGIP